MPLSPLQIKRLLLANEELAQAPKPCFGVNIFDIPTENLPRFIELGKKFIAEGEPLQELLHYKLSHFSKRDYGNGVARLVIMFDYPKPFDMESLMAIVGNDPDFANDYFEWCQCPSHYEWFVTCETPVPGAWLKSS